MGRTPHDDDRAILDERHPTIKPRRVSFDWSDTPLHWIPGDPVATHIINTLHLVLPAGERWFVQAYKDALPLIKDERLRAEVRGFMGQEAVHARSHAGVLGDLLAEHGIDHARVTRLPDRMVAGRPAFRERLPKPVRRRLLIYEVAAIAAIEHYTAVLGQWILDAEALDEAEADPVMLDLLRWHGAEEVEHRSVAFDVFMYLSGSWILRMTTWAVALLALYTAIIGGTFFLLSADPSITRRVTFLKVARAYRKAARRGRVPRIGVFAREAPVYLNRRHHPSRVCSTRRAIDYLSHSPAARAAAR